MANYDLNTVVSKPVSGDVKLKIYDKTSKLKYTLDPKVAFFYRNAHIVMIKVQDSNDIYLDFSSTTESTAALSKLNTVKQELLVMIQSGGGIITNKKITVFSKNNNNMNAKLTSNDGDLACDTAITDIPVQLSPVKVLINGIEVNVGGKVYPFDCYFSQDGITPRINGDERVGDKLYWNQSIAGYNLDTTDLIDFVYLIQIDV